MNRQSLHQIIPGIIMAGAAAVPVITTAEILMHVPSGGSLAGPRPSAPVAVLPSGPSSGGPRSIAPTSSGGTQTYRGPVVNEPFGGVQATVILGGKKITDVAISAPQDNPRSANINQQAVPLLRSETLQVQSAQINIVSGATYTSEAYAQSLQAALDQARRQGNGVAGTSPSAHPASGASAGTNQAPSVSVSEDD